MKTNKLIVALALPLAFAACTNEEILENSTSPVVGANLVEVNGIAVGLGGFESRGLWEAGSGSLYWSWIPEVSEEGESVLGETSQTAVFADQIGLCWTGELADGTGSISNKVYSNYEFLHFAWLNKNQGTASFDLCKTIGDAGYVKNGKQYSEIDGTFNNLTTTAETKAEIAEQNSSLNLSTGVFKTENKAIFGGSYVVYSPYNPNFVDAASLPATSATVFDVNVDEGVEAAHIHDNTFLVGYAKDLVGGSQASKLSLDPLSGIVSIQLRAKTFSDEALLWADYADLNIEKIALWSEDGFIKSVSLNAAKIKANGALAGEALYVAGTKETANTIVANLESEEDILVGPYSTAEAATKIYLPLLPTTAKNLKVILYAEDGRIAVISLGQNYKFEAGKGTIVNVPVAYADFKNAKIAVDQETLQAALDEDAANIIVAGDIRLTQNLEIENHVTIEGDDIIVPATVTMSVKGLAATRKATIKSNIIVESEGCCDQIDGKLVANNYSVFYDIDNMGVVNAAEGTSTFNGTLKNSFDSADANKNQTGLEVSKDATFALNGTFENAANALNKGYFNMNEGSKVINDALINNKNMFTNNSTQANFQNNDTYVDMLGGLLNGKLLTNNDEYICEVDNDAERMNYALEKRTMVTTVRFVASGWYDFSAYAGDDFSHLKFDVNATDKIGFVGGQKISGKYQPMELKIKSLIVNSDLRVNRESENDAVTIKNNKLSLVVKEGVTIYAGTLSFEQPILSTIGTSLTMPDWNGNGVFSPMNGAMLEIGKKSTMKGEMYIGAGDKAVIGNNVKINVYGYVNKHSSNGTFMYDDATGNGSVAGEVRCDDYNGKAGWAAGHAPVIDKFFVFE